MDSLKKKQDPDKSMKVKLVSRLKLLLINRTSFNNQGNGHVLYSLEDNDFGGISWLDLHLAPTLVRIWCSKHKHFFILSFNYI